MSTEIPQAATTTNTKAATGTHVTNGLPHGNTSLTPHLVVSPAARALEIYASVFGAQVEHVTRMEGLIAHADLVFAVGRATLSDPLPAYGLSAPRGEGVTYSLALYVEDTDAVAARAVAAGFVLREPASTFVSGDRYASLLDPFGVRWSVMTRVEDLSRAESAARVERWASAMAGHGG